MKIEVTWDDINFGRRHSPQYCPIALAAQRASGESWIVSDSMMWIKDSAYGQNIYLDAGTKEFIRNFDEGEPVLPFSFEAE